MASATGSTCFGNECLTLVAKTEGQNSKEKRFLDRFGIGMMELPKGTISVRILAYAV